MTFRQVSQNVVVVTFQIHHDFQGTCSFFIVDKSSTKMIVISLKSRRFDNHSVYLCNLFSLEVIIKFSIDVFVILFLSRDNFKTSEEISKMIEIIGSTFIINRISLRKKS